MIPIPSLEMFVNKFVDVKLPTKKQIFARVGGFSTGQMYSGDVVVKPGMKPTEQAEAFINAAENYEPPKEDLSTEDENA